MIVALLIIFGLCLGSFINALIWRTHELNTESSKKKPDKQYLKKLSISTGRSICPKCKHELTPLDLIPVLSWLILNGKCRYCKKPISIQYPLVEITTALLFVVSYLCWPVGIHGSQIALIIIWLLLLVGLIALAVYDIKWFLLPNKLIYPLYSLAILYSAIVVLTANRPLISLLNVILSVAVGGGIFYILFQVSGGKWIGGGDVRLGWLLGLIAGTPSRSLLFIFLASILGTIVSLPLLASKRLKRNSFIPFGPFLIAGAFLMELFGSHILHWYQFSLIHM